MKRWKTFLSLTSFFLYKLPATRSPSVIYTTAMSPDGQKSAIPRLSSNNTFTLPASIHRRQSQHYHKSGIQIWFVHLVNLLGHPILTNNKYSFSLYLLSTVIHSSYKNIIVYSTVQGRLGSKRTVQKPKHLKDRCLPPPNGFQITCMFTLPESKDLT